MKLGDGKVIDGTVFYDTISFNDLWARVQRGAALESLPANASRFPGDE